jgi:ubiquinone/menaquinone biosynthesis C-methylase UbiE
MGIIFDSNIARLYETWYHSPQGRTIDRSIEHLLVALLDPMPRQRILDIGCGTGNHLIMFSKLGLHVSGIDASPYMIRKAKERLGHRCTLKTAMAEDLPFEDNEFDFAVFINTLEFLDDPLSALREAGRVASERVFVGVLNSLSWGGRIKKIHGFFGNRLFRSARLFNLWQMKSLLQMAYGLVPISWGCIRTHPSLIEEINIFSKDFLTWKHSPFASFLGFSATMEYHVKTDNLPLKIRLKKANQPLIGVRTFGDLRRFRGVHGDERGIFI